MKKRMFYIFIAVLTISMFGCAGSKTQHTPSNYQPTNTPAPVVLKSVWEVVIETPDVLKGATQRFMLFSNHTWMLNTSGGGDGKWSLKDDTLTIKTYDGITKLVGVIKDNAMVGKTMRAGKEIQTWKAHLIK